MCFAWSHGRCQLSPQACKYAHWPQEMLDARAGVSSQMADAGRPTDGNTSVPTNVGGNVNSVGFARHDASASVSSAIGAKMKICFAWRSGRCKLQPSQCRFAHGPDDFNGNQVSHNFCSASYQSWGMMHYGAHTFQDYSNNGVAMMMVPVQMPVQMPAACSFVPATAPMMPMMANQDGRQSASSGGGLDFEGVRPIVTSWLEEIHTRIGAERMRTSDGAGRPPSLEDCKQALLNAMPDVYEE